MRREAPPDVSADPEKMQRALAITQQDAVDLREYAVGRRPEAPLKIEEKRLEELRRGNPLPADLLHQLAQGAIQKIEES